MIKCETINYRVLQGVKRIMEFKDYYKILEVEPTAAIDDIKKSYRKMARRYHPDVSKETDSENKFKEVSEAWEVLKNPEKRKEYDAMRQGGFRAGQDFHPQGQYRKQQDFSAEDLQGFSEFFNAMFGGHAGNMGGTSQHRQMKRKGQNIDSKIQIPLNVAFHGGTQEIQMNAPHDGKRIVLKVTIPKGVLTGSHIRLKGKGMPGIGGGEPGDLHLEIEVLPYKSFTLVDKNIFQTLPISPWEAALGGTVKTPTLDGMINVKIPKGASSGQKLRVKEKGLPTKPPGDLILTLQIQTPEPKDDAEKALYQEMADKLNYNPRLGME
tara:strand:+ start:11159 stop:12127 length:969 start_codon:yes stop_codon:yes gene_type:complete